jgi:hypothetical protein
MHKRKKLLCQDHKVNTLITQCPLKNCTKYFAYTRTFENDLFPNTAAQQKQYVDTVWCHEFFSGLISMFVFDILQICRGYRQICSGYSASPSPPATGLNVASVDYVVSPSEKIPAWKDPKVPQCYVAAYVLFSALLLFLVLCSAHFSKFSNNNALDEEVTWLIIRLGVIFSFILFWAGAGTAQSACRLGYRL